MISWYVDAYYVHLILNKTYYFVSPFASIILTHGRGLNFFTPRGLKSCCRLRSPIVIHSTPPSKTHILPLNNKIIFMLVMCGYREYYYNNMVLLV